MRYCPILLCAVLLGCGQAGVLEQTGLLAPPLMPPFAGTREMAPAFLDEGGTLFWIHQRDCEAVACIAKPPYRSVASARLLMSYSCGLRVSHSAASADGRHVFVGNESTVIHLEVESGAIAREATIAASGEIGLNLVASNDGRRVFYDFNLFPWYHARNDYDAVALITRGENWTQILLSGTEKGERARLVGARSDGRMALYLARKSEGATEQPVFAEEVSGAWSGVPVSFSLPSEASVEEADRALIPVAMTATGTLVLLRGRERGPHHEELFVSWLEGESWAAPELVASERGAALMDPGISADGSQVFWTRSIPASGARTSLRSEVRVAKKQNSAWSAASAVHFCDGQILVDRKVFLGTGQAAFYSCSPERSNQPYGELPLYATPDIDNPESAVNLASLDCEGLLVGH